MLNLFAKFVFRHLLRLVDNPRHLFFCGEPVFALSGYRWNRCMTPTNLALIRLDRLGDVVLSSHMVAGLRRAWPKSRITLIVRESLVDLARLCPDVDEVIGVPVDEWGMLFDPETGKYGGWKRQLTKWLKICHAVGIWKRRFDVAITPRWDTDYYGAILLAYLSGASQRWGVTERATSKKARLNWGFDRLLTQIVAGEIVLHEFLLNESFLQQLNLPSDGGGKLVSWVVPSDQEKAVEIMRAAGVRRSKKTIIVCLGANSAPRRMWPVESYAQLCRAVFNPELVQFVTVGTAAEQSLGRQFKALVGDIVINLEGDIPLGLLPATVALGALYIGSDTGTMHLASAAGVPVFEVSCHPMDGDAYWAESPLRFGPWAVPHRVVQPEHATAPCQGHCDAGTAHCILAVSVERAAEALQSLLLELGLTELANAREAKMLP